jgi:hypothetical protein
MFAAPQLAKKMQETNKRAAEEGESVMSISLDRLRGGCLVVWAVALRSSFCGK